MRDIQKEIGLFSTRQGQLSHDGENPEPSVDLGQVSSSGMWRWMTLMDGVIWICRRSRLVRDGLLTLGLAQAADQAAVKRPYRSRHAAASMTWLQRIARERRPVAEGKPSVLT